LACASVTYSTCTPFIRLRSANITESKRKPAQPGRQSTCLQKKRYNFVCFSAKAVAYLHGRHHPPPLPTVKFGGGKDGVGVMLKLHEYGA
jgi:hypothetical protein